MKEDFCMYAQKVKRSKENAQGKALEKDMRSYICESCRTWHLTSQPLITPKRYEYPVKEYELDY